VCRDWKPEEYSSVSPYLMVDGVLRVADFLHQVFGATERRRFGPPDGGVTDPAGDTWWLSTRTP